MRVRYFGAIGAVLTSLTLLMAPASAAALPAGMKVADARILVHFSLASGQQPENIALEPGGDGARVESVRLAASGWRVRVRRVADGAILEALLPRDRFPSAPTSDQPCGISINASRCHLMPSDQVAEAPHSMTLATSS